MISTDSGMDGQSEILLQKLGSALENDSYWRRNIDKTGYTRSNSFGIHLAIFIEPYLKYIFEGKKTVESRFSVNRIAPYKRVETGDIILLKRSGGPIVGICEISDVWFYHLDPKSWRDIKNEFMHALCAQDPSFWAQRSHASFATLMQIKNARNIQPIPWPKRDRRGWVVLWHKGRQTTFE